MDESTDKAVKTRISLTLTRVYIEALDQLVEAGVYVSRGEIVKDALRRIFRHYGIKPFSPKGEAEASRGENLNKEELIERIDTLKESEATIRAERQELENQLRNMMCDRLLIKRSEG